ncbi:MAG TPA: hypothetical protein VFN35_05780 [Ktedonobacteraceae bacterium]|nr:hypothetical protein [Ktedonobacteraceae bacterium]
MKHLTMKPLSLKRVLTLGLCLCLAVTLLTAFSPTRSAHAATAKATACQTLRYAPGQFFLSAGGRKEWTTCAGNTMDLNMQTDGNFVLYLNGHPIWASGRPEQFISGDWVKFQTDSNLVVYDIDDLSGAVFAAWDSRTNGKNASSFELQSDGNMVIYASSGPIWSSHTNGH